MTILGKSISLEHAANELEVRLRGVTLDDKCKQLVYEIQQLSRQITDESRHLDRPPAAEKYQT